MAWQKILGHDAVVAQFRAALERGRLASTFLFVGPPGVGKRTFALQLAQGLLCDTVAPHHLEPCGRCPACTQIAAGSHPDVEVVSRPADKAIIPVELFIGDREHRMRAGLCYNISLKPFSGKRRIAIIDDADYVNQEGANSLLKTLEEPPPGAMIILLSSSEQRQLPTIRSRSQVIRFQPLSTSEVETILLQQNLVETQTEATRAAASSEGSVERGIAVSDPALAEFQAELYEQLSRNEFDVPALAKLTMSFADGAGKEAAAKRGRLKQAVASASEFYRGLMRSLSGSPLASGDALARAVAITERWWPGGEEAATFCLEACLDATSAIETNANQSTLLECWYDELGVIARR